jgi:hypothetical protein
MTRKAELEPISTLRPTYEEFAKFIPYIESIEERYSKPGLVKVLIYIFLVNVWMSACWKPF